MTFRCHEYKRAPRGDAEFEVNDFVQWYDQEERKGHLGIVVGITEHVNKKGVLLYMTLDVCLNTGDVVVVRSTLADRVDGLRDA